MILHLVSQTEWAAKAPEAKAPEAKAPEAKAPDQPYLPDRFPLDGFIHCTAGDDVLLQVANRFYKNVPGDFLVLGIDESKVKAQIKWEPPSSITPPAPPPPAKEMTAPAVPLPPEVKAEYGETQVPPSPALPNPPAPAAAPVAQLFPHIYGPLNRDAIVEMRKVVRAVDGTFTGFAPMPQAAAAAAPEKPAGMNLKTPSQLANELVDATGDFSDALARYKDRVQARMDELDKDNKSRLGE
jgi:uncharacterized protein (DUF952 family)